MPTRTVFFETQADANEYVEGIQWLKRPVPGDFYPSHDNRTHAVFQQLRPYGNQPVSIIGFKPNGSPLSGDLFIQLEEKQAEKTIVKIARVKPGDFKGGRALLAEVGLI